MNKIVKTFLPVKDTNFDNLMPFELPLNILRGVGMWLTKDSSWQYIIFSLLMHFIFIDGLIVLQLLYFLQAQTFIDFSMLFCVLPSCIGAWFESYAYQINKGKLFGIMDLIRECIDEFGLSDHSRRRLMKIDKIFKTLLANMLFTVITHVIFTTIQHEIMAKIWIPFDVTEGYNFYLVITYQTGALTFYTLVSLCYDLIPAIFMVYLVGMLEQLCERFENLKHDTITKGDEPSSSRKNGNRPELIKCINYQLKIRDIVNELNSTFSVLFLIRGLFSMVIFCTNIFTMVKFSNFKVIGNLLHMLALIFFPCYYGSQMTAVSKRVSDSILGSEWMHEDKEYRQLVKIMMEFAQPPYKITAGGIFEVNLETFKRIIESAYSMYCLCIQIIRH
jgi:hypothetical protein